MSWVKFIAELLFLLLVCLPIFCIAYILIELSFFIYYTKKNLNKWKINTSRRFRRK